MIRFYGIEKIKITYIGLNLESSELNTFSIFYILTHSF